MAEYFVWVDGYSHEMCGFYEAKTTKEAAEKFLSDVDIYDIIDEIIRVSHIGDAAEFRTGITILPA